VSHGHDQPFAGPEPRVTVSLLESDESSTALLLAIAAAGPERAMRLELAGLLLEGHVATPNLKQQRAGRLRRADCRAASRKPSQPRSSILVADAFEAMTSDRPYRLASGQSYAIDQLRGHAGTQFDPDIVDALTRCLDKTAGAALDPVFDRVRVSPAAFGWALPRGSGGGEARAGQTLALRQIARRCRQPFHVLPLWTTQRELFETDPPLFPV
jgi:hypothetical protein